MQSRAHFLLMAKPFFFLLDRCSFEHLIALYNKKVERPFSISSALFPPPLDACVLFLCHTPSSDSWISLLKLLAVSFFSPTYPNEYLAPLLNVPSFSPQQQQRPSCLGRALPPHTVLSPVFYLGTSKCVRSFPSGTI